MSEGTDNPAQTEDGAGLVTSSSDWDHPNIEKLNRWWLPTHNNEHTIQGITPSKDMLAEKLEIDILHDLAFINAGRVKAEVAAEIEASRYVAKMALDRRREGFERRLGQTTIEEQKMIYGPAPKKGWLRNPFRKEKPQEQMVPA